MPRKILFVTATRIGDAVLSCGLLDWLTREYPDARFTIACGPHPAPLFERHPRLERTIVLRKRKLAGHWRDLWKSVRHERWDMAVDLRRSLIPWLIRARRRASQPRPAADEHRVELIGRTLGLAPPPAPRLWLTESDRTRAANMLGEAKTVLAIAPTANWTAKTWPAERFAELVQRLTARDAVLHGAKIFVTGGPDEEALVRPILEAVPPEWLIVRLGLDLPTTAAVFERSHLFIGNDSGLMHMAAAVGTPTIGLFGPTRDKHYAPWGRHCRTVRTPESAEELTGTPGFDHRRTGSLMENLGVGEVERAANDLLRITAVSAGHTNPDRRQSTMTLLQE